MAIKYENHFIGAIQVGLHPFLGGTDRPATFSGPEQACTLFLEESTSNLVPRDLHPPSTPV